MTGGNLGSCPQRWCFPRAEFGRRGKSASGSARAAFQPDLIVGASAGGWNGWAIAGGHRRNWREWLDPQTGRALRSEALRVRRDNFRAVSAARALRADHGGDSLVALRIVRDREITWQHLAACCAIPFGFPPVRLPAPLCGWRTDGRAAALGGGDWGHAGNRAQLLNTPGFRMMHRSCGGGSAGHALEVVRIEPSLPLGSVLPSVRGLRPISNAGSRRESRMRNAR